MTFFHRNPGNSRAVLFLIVSMLRETRAIKQKLGEIMAAQDDINAANQAVASLLTDLQAQTSSLVSDLTELQAVIAAGQPVDTSALNATVAGAQAVQEALDAAVASINDEANPPAPQP